MKKFKKCASLALALTLTLCCSACGGGDAYSGYSDAYKKTSSVGSLNVVFDLSVGDGSQTMKSSGDMKMNGSDLSYVMKINGNEVSQYVKDGKVHTFVDGEEQIASIGNKDKGPEKADPEGGKDQPNEKTDGNGFNSEKFLEEFSGMLEAGKIKEMGVLDPIPSNYIKEITSSESGGETVYTMTFPDEFLSKFLEALTSEQTELSSDKITFDKLKDFSCTAKKNADGYIYFIEYKGSTTATVAGELMASGTKETFDLSIDLQMTIQNPGTAVEVTIP